MENIEESEFSLISLAPTLKSCTNNISAIRVLEENVPEVVQRFNISWSVGSGHFGSVLVGSEKTDQSHTLYAIKLIGSNSSREAIENELKYLKCLRGCKNIVEYVDHMDNGKFAAIVTKYVKSDCFAKDFRAFTPKNVSSYMKNLLIAINKLHDFRVSHGDIKPRNFLYNLRENRFVLADLGMVMPFGMPCRDRGTKGYIAPECILRYQYSSGAMDIFAAGVVFMSLLSGIRPFFVEKSKKGLQEFATFFGYEAVKKVIYDLRMPGFLECLAEQKDCKPISIMKTCKFFRNYEHYTNKIADPDRCNNCKQYLIYCLCEDYCNGVYDPLYQCRDIFPRSAYELLEMMLKLNPHERINVRSALSHRFFSDPITFKKAVCETREEKFNKGIVKALNCAKTEDEKPPENIEQPNENN